MSCRPSSRDEWAAARGVSLGILVEKPDRSISRRDPLGLCGEDLAEAERIAAHLEDHRQIVSLECRLIFDHRRWPTRFD